MKAEVNQFGKLIVTIGYNFSIQFGTDQIMLDEQHASLMMASIVGKPFKNKDKINVGKVIDFQHVSGTCHFYVYVEIYDQYKDIMLMQLQAHKAGNNVSMESKVVIDGKSTQESKD